MSNLVKRHDLKVHCSLWAALVGGAKTAEFRKNDRGFLAGDTLHLFPVDDGGEAVSGLEGCAWMNFTVTHIVHGPEFGVPDGYCMMSLGPYYSVPH